MKISERVKGLCVADGVSQAEFARRCGLEPYEMSRIVTGRRRPQLHQLQAIATAEGMALEELVAGTDAEHLLGQEPKLVSRSELEEVLQRALKAEETARTLEAEKKALTSELETSQKKAREARARVIEVEGQAMLMKASLEGAEVDAGTNRVRYLLHEAKHDAVENELQELRERFSIGAAQYGELRQAFLNLQQEYGLLWRDHTALAQEYAVEVQQQQASKIATAGLTGLVGLAFGALVSGD